MTGADFRHALTESLLGRSDDELVALLAARPDLASPAPSTLVALAARAAARTSVERALATLDAAAPPAFKPCPNPAARKESCT